MPKDFQLEPNNLSLTPYPAKPFVILSTVCEKVTEEWQKVFQEVAKGGGSFWFRILFMKKIR